MKMENKVVPSYASTNAENKERCHVYLLDLYMKKVPKGALSKGAFYFHPVSKVSDIPGSEWCNSIPVGKNMLQKMLPMMCEEAGIARRTNHSLCATGATDMFLANIPEKVTQSHTSHLSLKALWMYENLTDEQHSAACSVLIDRRNVTPPEVLKPIQPLAGPVPSTMVQASSTTHNISVVPSALFGSANCTINVQVFNQASIQNFQGMSTSVTVAVDADDDTFLDSVLVSSDLQV